MERGGAEGGVAAQQAGERVVRGRNAALLSTLKPKTSRTGFACI